MSKILPASSPFLAGYPPGEFQANMAMKIDMLSSAMLVLVTTVSSLVHIYSVGYMSHDKHPQLFYGLSLTLHLLHAYACGE